VTFPAAESNGMYDFKSARAGLAPLGCGLRMLILDQRQVNRGCFRSRRSAGNRARRIFTAGFPAKSRFSQGASRATRFAAGTRGENKHYAALDAEGALDSNLKQISLPPPAVIRFAVTSVD